MTVYTFTATPIFEAKTQLLIETEKQNVVNFKQVVDEDQTQGRLLPDAVQDPAEPGAGAPDARAAEAVGHDPQFGGRGRRALQRHDGDRSARPSALVGLVQGRRHGRDEPGSRRRRDRRRSRGAIDAFLAGLTVAPIRNSRLVDVKYQLPDPALATRIVNALAQELHRAEPRVQVHVVEGGDRLAGRAAGRAAQGRSSRRAAQLQRYREQNDSISLEDRENIVVQKLADLNAAVTRAKTERIQKEALYQQLQALAGRSGRGSTPSRRSSPTPSSSSRRASWRSCSGSRRSCREKLGDKHPDMVKLTLGDPAVAGQADRAKSRKVVQSVRNEYQAALAQENSLTAALEPAEGRCAVDEPQGHRLRRARSATLRANQQIYDSLMQRTKETGISGELKTSNIRVVDAAETPRAPVSPQQAHQPAARAVRRRRCWRCGLAFFFEYLDSRIKTPGRDPGSTSACRTSAWCRRSFEKDGDDPLISNGVPANFARSVPGDPHQRAVLVGGGGRAVAGRDQHRARRRQDAWSRRNLAIALAQAGQRVLLIDADMRKPRVHEHLRLHAGARAVERAGRQREGERGGAARRASPACG